MRKNFRYVVLLALAAALVLGSGCNRLRGGKKNSAAGEGGDQLNLNGYSEFGDEPIGGRMEGDEWVPEGGRFSPVLFSYDSAEVEPAERAKVDAVAEEMMRNRDLNLVLEGHCDERGSREYNMALGEHRALAVRAYLVGLGVEADRITTKSYGEENPADFGHDEAAWSQNRRAEFMLVQ
jgi:peptidoglycan-associated lipoprotein